MVASGRRRLQSDPKTPPPNRLPPIHPRPGPVEEVGLWSRRESFGGEVDLWLRRESLDGVFLLPVHVIGLFGEHQRAFWRTPGGFFEGVSGRGRRLMRA